MIRWVIFYDGVPPSTVFGTTRGQGTPLVIDKNTGLAYTLLPDGSVTSIAGGPATAHGTLSGLQGGSVGEYYHLTQSEHTALTTNLTETVESIAMPTLAVRYDQDQDPPNYAFIGTADPGASEASAVWRIQKVTFDLGGDVTVSWADGNANFDNVWANRASLSYS